MDDSATIHLFRGPPARTFSSRVQAIHGDGELHSPVELTADFESDSDNLHHSYSSNPLKGVRTPLTSSPLDSKTFLDVYSTLLNEFISLAPSSPSSPVQHRPPPSTPHRRDSSVGRVVVQHEIAHALAALDANVLALQAARYDPDLLSAPNTPGNGSSYLSVKESPRTPLSRPSAPTPGSERSISASLPPSPLRGLFPRRAGSFTLPSPPFTPTVEALGSGDDDDLFGFIPNTPTQHGYIADPDDWTLSSPENSMEASMSLRDMFCAATSPHHIHRVQAQGHGGDGDGEGELDGSELDGSELSFSTPTPPLGDAASPVNQTERVHITTVELSADEMHLVGPALLQAMEDVLERDFDILAKCEYTNCLVRSDDWWAEPEVSCGDEESILDYISYHASDRESESDDSADLHLSHASYLDTRSSWDEHNGIIPCLPLLGEIDTASSDNLQFPDSPTAFHDQTATELDYDVRFTSSDGNFETDELDDSYDRGFDPARRASLSTIYEVSTESDYGQPTVHAYDSEEESTGDEDSHESLLAVAMQRVRVLSASIDFDPFDDSDDDELPGPHPSPNSDGANDHSKWGEGLSFESLSFNNATGSPLSASKYNRARSSKLADRAGLGLGLPPVHDSYLPRTDNGSPPLETPGLDTAMLAQYGFGRDNLGLGTASSPHLGEPRDTPLLTAPRLNKEVGDLRADSYCRMYQEPAEHYRLSPDATAALVPQAQVDSTNITPRSARRASLSAAVKGGEGSSPYGKGEWSASDTLALLNGWSNDERDEKELELRRKYRDTAGPKTAGRAVIEERIAELERKIALSKTYKASEAVGNGEGHAGVASSSKNLRSLGELTDELEELEAYKRFVGGASSGDAQWATQIAEIDCRLATLRLELTKTYKYLAHATVSRHKGGVRNRSVERTLSSKVDEWATDERESMQNFKFGSPPPSPSSPTFAAYPSTTSRAAPYGPGGIEQYGFIGPNTGSRRRRRSRFEGPDLSDVEEIEERDSTHVDSYGGHDAVEERRKVRLEDESALNDGELCSMVNALRDCIAGGHVSPTDSEATASVSDINCAPHAPEWQTSILRDTEHLKIMNDTEKGGDRGDNRTDGTWAYTPDDVCFIASLYHLLLTRTQMLTRSKIGHYPPCASPTPFSVTPSPRRLSWTWAKGWATAAPPFPPPHLWVGGAALRTLHFRSSARLSSRRTRPTSHYRRTLRTANKWTLRMAVARSTRWCSKS